MDIIIGSTLGILGIIVSIYLYFRNISQQQIISWKRVLKYVQKITDELKSEEWEPEVILSFPKGGLIVADLFGHQFDNKLDIVSIHTKRIRENNTVEVLIRHPYVNLNALKGKKILVVDDIISGGATMKRVNEIVGKIPDTDVKTAVLGFTKPTYFEPNYKAFDYNRNKDLFLPWGRLTL